MSEYLNHNPDVLSCLASLSNDEVFTPPQIVNQMLDLLPQDMWSNSKIKFLDPCCKSGVFLREIAKRLNDGLKDEIPDLQERINHICKNQLYGIAITELTSLLSRRSVYCSKYANGEYSICTGEFSEEGNILFEPMKHTWSKNGNCTYCGANKGNYDRSTELESHAYQFIHILEPEAIFNMKFDVIIGNPPYQMSDGGNGTSAKPIYQLFVEQAKKLNPRYLTMIIPARWFAGGKGLDRFRQDMLNDKRVRKLVDYENSDDVFKGVDIAGGICYFLWDRDNEGLCDVTSHFGNELSTSSRALNEFETFIRHSKAEEIVKKVMSKHKGAYLDQFVSSRKPFGLPTNYPPYDSGIPCWFIQRIGLQHAKEEDVDDSKGYLNKWKLLAPKSPIAGQTDFTKPVGFYYEGNTKIAKPGECCTESYIILGNFDTEEETISFKSYIFTKTVRFLLLQTVVSQDVTKKNYCFVPNLESYTGTYTDEILRNLWDIDDVEWRFIESRIIDIGKGRESNE